MEYFKSVGKLVICGVYDFGRFLKHSAITGKGCTEGQLLALIMKETHRIEKGLALPAPRPGFGRSVVAKLVPKIHVYLQIFGHHPVLFTSAGVLEQWSDFCRASNDNADLVEDVKKLALLVRGAAANALDISDQDVGAVRQSSEDLAFLSGENVKKLFQTRRSVRQYSDREVELEYIENAIAIAQYSPSVCNRQSARVHVFRNPADIESVLSFQAGNRGFGDTAKAVLIVTSELEAFSGARERYQGWIDGGMFSMSLLIGLHAQGLGACPLNWSASPLADAGLRKAHGIASNELIIMMIAVGHLRKEYLVAASPRISMEQIVRWR